MPQMSPLLWVSLMFVFVGIYLILLINFYFKFYLLAGSTLPGGKLKFSISLS